jgi:hypothetical protein
MDGTFGTIRLSTVIEEHGAGRQLARLRLLPRLSRWALFAVCCLTTLAVWAGWDGSMASTLFAGSAFMVAYRTLADLGAATAVVHDVVKTARKNVEEPKAFNEIQAQEQVNN